MLLNTQQPQKQRSSSTISSASSTTSNPATSIEESKPKKMTRLHRTLSVVKRGLSSRPPTPSGNSPPSSPAITVVNGNTNDDFSLKNGYPSPAVSSTSSIKSSDSTIKNSYQFQISEAFMPKIREDSAMEQARLSNLYKTRDGIVRPDSGEDAFFKCQISKGTKKGSMAFGVADGVGGWSTIGVDPSLYSFQLCQNMKKQFLKQEKDSNLSETPLSVLEIAYNKIKDKKQVEAGSSTACVGMISPNDGILHVANLGDSGYSIFREGRLYRQSKPQTHVFNTPYQMAIIPENFKVDESQRIDDKPTDAETNQHNLQHGDVVVMSTDGLTDNMFAHEMLDIIIDLMVRNGSWIRAKDGAIGVGDNMTGSDELAASLVRHAAKYSLDGERNSPFAQELRRNLNLEGANIYGGKPDDITVMVLLVQK